jgi:hypothetical protein
MSLACPARQRSDYHLSRLLSIRTAPQSVEGSVRRRRVVIRKRLSAPLRSSPVAGRTTAESTAIRLRLRQCASTRGMRSRATCFVVGVVTSQRQ